MRVYIRHCGRKRGKEAMTVAEEPNKHIKKLEDQIERLKKEVQSCKQVRLCRLRVLGLGYHTHGQELSEPWVLVH